MFWKNYHDTSYYKILFEIKKNIKDYMSTQFEHNSFLPKNLKNTMLDAIAKQLDDVNKEVPNIQTQFAPTEQLLGKFRMHKLR